jgi:ABC-type transport system substrate-binding protein
MNESKNAISRRQLLKLAGIAAGGGLLAACNAAPAAPSAPAASPEAPKATEAPAAAPAGAKKMPDDAAPIEHQVLVGWSDSGRTYLDATMSIYNAHGGANLHNLPPVMFNHDFELLPASAKSWKLSEDGLTWAFTLRDDIKWTDGKALNADDYIAAMQVVVNPAWAHDFNWYYGETKLVNFAEATKGEKPAAELGVKKGSADTELLMTSTGPVPFLPLMLPYFTAVHAQKVWESDGVVNKTYNLDPATAVSCGPYVLKENTPERTVFEANKAMPVDLQPYIQKVITVVIPPEQRFQAYQANQLDHLQLIQTADIQAVLANPALKAQVQADVGDFRCDYAFFDITKEPFSNDKFRQAISHLVNRDAIIENITTPLASKPAFGFLAPGFPGHNPELSKIQNYDPEKAKALYAESGLKVDKLLLEVRSNDGETRKTIGEFIGATIKENLGIDVEVAFVDQKIFMEKLNKKPTEIGFGMISYGMDYLDQSNMLSVFRTGGRHNWNNEAYQKLLDDAGPEKDVAKRNEMYKQAEMLLAESRYAIFIAFRTVPKMMKSYVSGASLLPGKLNTVPGMNWPDYATLANHPFEMYINKSVLEQRPTPPA